MALSITVSKKSVTQIMVGAYRVTINLSCSDNSVEVINQDFSITYKQGGSVPKLKADLASQMQAAINAYKAEQTLYNSAAMNNAVTDIQSALVG